MLAVLNDNDCDRCGCFIALMMRSFVLFNCVAAQSWLLANHKSNGLKLSLS
jgi:hypothetical protein